MNILCDTKFVQASAIGDLDLDLLSSGLGCGDNYGCDNGNGLGIGDINTLGIDECNCFGCDESDALWIGESYGLGCDDGGGIYCDGDSFDCVVVGTAIAITLEYNDNIYVTNQYLFRHTNTYSQINAPT